MAKHRSQVPKGTARRLRKEAGGKCANPGCPVIRTQLHHIKPWAIYQSHDGSDMIAVCPSCHDEIHHGRMAIDDDSIRAWKALRRPQEVKRSHVYIEPSEHPTVVLGNFAIRGKAGATIVDLSPGHSLRFEIRGDEILLLSLRISDLEGSPAIEVVDGYVKSRDSSALMHESGGGRIRISTKVADRFIPSWAISCMHEIDPDYAAEETTLLRVRVDAPGVVRVEGVWATDSQAFIVTPTHLAVISNTRAPLFLTACDSTGQAYDAEVPVGKGPILQWEGPINAALFGSLIAIQAGSALGS